MSKVSRNEPCPCGSGKKYKKCCLGKILSFSNKNNFDGDEVNSSNQFLEMVDSEFEMSEFASLEEMNEKLGQLSQNYNEMPQLSFLGVSPEQMRVVLSSLFSFDNILLKFEGASEYDFMQVPILYQAIYFLNKLKDVGELKATKKGNLPKAFVIELYEKFFTEGRYARKPHKEDDLPQATRLKYLLDLAGLVKKRNGKFSLTRKGLLLMKGQKLAKLYEVIFLTYVNKWNWAYSDGYPDFPLFQKSASFNFLLISRKCNGWILDSELGKHYFDAFPNLSDEAEVTAYSTPEDQVIHCFTHRFLKGVCIPLGLLEFKEERVKKGDYFEWLEYYRPTDLFLNNWKFKIK